MCVCSHDSKLCIYIHCIHTNCTVYAYLRIFIFLTFYTSGLNTISISAAQSGNEIQLHCSWHAVEVGRYNVSFREVGIIIDPSYHPITVHHHSNRSLLEAWLTLSSHPRAYFGNYSCCASEVPMATNEEDTLVCSNTLNVLPSSGEQSE